MRSDLKTQFKMTCKIRAIYCFSKQSYYKLMRNSKKSSYIDADIVNLDNITIFKHDLQSKFQPYFERINNFGVIYLRVRSRIYKCLSSIFTLMYYAILGY